MMGMIAMGAGRSVETLIIGSGTMAVKMFEGSCQRWRMGHQNIKRTDVHSRLSEESRYEDVTTGLASEDSCMSKWSGR